LKDRARPVSANSHTNGFRHTRADKVPDCCSPKVVEELPL